MPRAKSAPPRFVFPVDDVADVFGINVRTVQRMVKDGMPQIGRGQYDVRACVQWKLAEMTAEAADKGRTDRDLLAQAQREKVLLEVAELRGELVPRDLVQQTLNRVASLVSGQLDGLGPRLAGELADSDDPSWIQSRLFTEARALRASIAQEIRSLGAQIKTGEALAVDDDEDGVDDEAA